MIEGVSSTTVILAPGACRRGALSSTSCVENVSVGSVFLSSARLDFVGRCRKCAFSPLRKSFRTRPNAVRPRFQLQAQRVQLGALKRASRASTSAPSISTNRPWRLRWYLDTWFFGKYKNGSSENTSPPLKKYD